MNKSQQGMSLIELMIAVTLGLLLLAGVTAIFVNNNQTRMEIEKTSRQIENGRYAMDLISSDLEMAGYLGEYVPTTAPTGSVPDPCSTDLAVLTTAMPLFIQGYNNSSGSLACLSDVKSGTDVLVIRRTSTCTSANPAESGCDGITSGFPYLQVSGCITDASPFVLSSTSANFTLKKIGCGTTALASVRRLRTHIYFIANNNIAGDGIPTLKRWELGTGIVPLVEGIETLQFEYGLDTASNDGIPDAFVPNSADSPAFPSSIAEWWNVMTVKVGLLARNDTMSVDYQDNRAYTLPGGHSYTPSGGSSKYRRQVYTASVALANPVGRRQ